MTDFYGEIFGNFSCPSPRQTLVPVLWVQFHALLTCDYKSELISIQIFVKSGLNGLNGATRLVVLFRGTQRQFSENYLFGKRFEI